MGWKRDVLEVGTGLAVVCGACLLLWVIGYYATPHLADTMCRLALDCSASKPTPGAATFVDAIATIVMGVVVVVMGTVASMAVCAALAVCGLIGSAFLPKREKAQAS